MGSGHVAAAGNVTTTNFPVLSLCRVWSYFEDDSGQTGFKAEHKSI